MFYFTFQCRFGVKTTLQNLDQYVCFRADKLPLAGEGIWPRLSRVRLCGTRFCRPFRAWDLVVWLFFTLTNDLYTVRLTWCMPIIPIEFSNKMNIYLFLILACDNQYEYHPSTKKYGNRDLKGIVYSNSLRYLRCHETYCLHGIRIFLLHW